MDGLKLDIAFTLHRHTCKKCRGRRACEEGWREFNDCAQIIARTKDEKRAQA